MFVGLLLASREAARRNSGRSDPGRENSPKPMCADEGYTLEQERDALSGQRAGARPPPGSGGSIRRGKRGRPFEPSQGGNTKLLSSPSLRNSRKPARLCHSCAGPRHHLGPRVRPLRTPTPGRPAMPRTLHPPLPGACCTPSLGSRCGAPDVGRLNTDGVSVELTHRPSVFPAFFLARGTQDTRVHEPSISNPS